MKKLIALLLLVTMAALSLSACFPAADDTTVNIGVMSGPTGMGMAKLMADNKDNADKYTFEVYSAPTTATSDAVSRDSPTVAFLPTVTFSSRMA